MTIKKIAAFSVVALATLAAGLTVAPTTAKAYTASQWLAHGDYSMTNPWSDPIYLNIWVHGYGWNYAYSQFYMPCPNSYHGTMIVNDQNASSHDTANGYPGQWADASIGDLWNGTWAYANTSPYVGAPYK